MTNSINDEKLLIDRLNKLRLKGLESVKVGDALNTILHHINQPIPRGKLKSVLIAIKYSLLDTISIEKNNSDFFCLESEFLRNRSDYQSLYNKVISTIPNPSIIYNCNRISPKSFVSVHFVIQWYIELRKVFNLDWALYILADLFVYYTKMTSIMERIVKSNCKYLITFCDFHPLDSIVVQTCKNYGIKTITLQHGHFSEGSIAFKYSHSDYFLGYGRYTYEAAEKSGYDCEKFVKLGMPHLIDVILENHVFHNNTKTITVILDSEVKEDVDLLSITHSFCEKYGFNRIIKLHPGHGFLKAYNESVYEEDEVILNEKTAVELINYSDFAVIAGGSTTFFEFLMRLFPAFIFSKHNQRLPGFEWCSFDSIDKLERLYNQNLAHLLDGYYINSREYVSETQNVRENYAEFFCERLYLDGKTLA